jgi:hypothetical protein
MDAKKCDRCGSFYVRKELKKDNAVDIFGKLVFAIELKYRGRNCDCGLDVDLCPNCMNDLKIFMEVKRTTPYTTKVEDNAKVEDPCNKCYNPHCEQCTYGYKSLEERKQLYKENKEM